MIRNKYLYIFCGLLACSASADEVKVYDNFEAAEARGKVENNLITEASGMAAGINNPDLLWTHNDSGNDPIIFLLDEKGMDKGSFVLKGVENRDWEDMTSGPGPDEDKNYLYVGEMGDNTASYEQKYIYRFEEPILGDPEEIKIFDTISFKFPDGKRDAECLMIDPATKDLYIISKREPEVGVYRASYPQTTTGINMLEKLGSIPYHNIVAGDISADGSGILLKTYSKILYWERFKNEPILQALQKDPVQITYDPEPQGEAIAWKKDMSGFFTLSEERHGIEAILYFYKRK